jgi:squalene synthase HpnC
VGLNNPTDDLADRATRQMSGENFPVAIRLLPSGPRQDLARVYAFARFVDDVGDEAPMSGTARLDFLDRIEREVVAAEQGVTPSLGPVSGVAPLIASGRVPSRPFLDLIEANRVDQRVSSYGTFDDLLGYCRLSAAPVGRIVLHLADAATPSNVTDADAVCAALQILEHCQDVGEDFRNGRCYLPAAELDGAGVRRSDLGRDTTSAPLRGVIAAQATRARDLLAAGPPLVGRLSGWARVAVAGYVAGGLATADALYAARYDVLGAEVRPARGRTVRHAVRLLVRRR